MFLVQHTKYAYLFGKFFKLELLKFCDITKKAPTINRRGFSAFINLFQLIIF